MCGLTRPARVSRSRASNRRRRAPHTPSRHAARVRPRRPRARARRRARPRRARRASSRRRASALRREIHRRRRRVRPRRRSRRRRSLRGVRRLRDVGRGRVQARERHGHAVRRRDARGGGARAGDEAAEEAGVRREDGDGTRGAERGDGAVSALRTVRRMRVAARELRRAGGAQAESSGGRAGENI